MSEKIRVPPGKFPAVASVTVNSQAGCSSDYPQFGMDESCKHHVLDYY